MGQFVPQHPAIALRSQSNRIRVLVVAALIALLAVAGTVILIADSDDQAGGGSSVHSFGHINYGGFNPATGRPEAAPLPQQSHPLQSTLSQPRYDGGPEEGTRGIERSAPEVSVNPSTGYPNTRYDGGPEEGTRGATSSSPAPVQRYDGGPDEGTRGPGFSTD